MTTSESIIKDKLNQTLSLLSEVESLLNNLSKEDFINYHKGQTTAFSALTRAENAIIEIMEEL